MASPHQITVGNHTFATKAALTEHIRALVRRYEDNVPLSAEDRDFVIALVCDRHPDVVAPLSK
jgi:hypothetical protein